MGGTFDHLHNGHKLLLSQALLSSDQKIIVGITTDSLLAKKAYAEYLEPFEARKHAVLNFCKRLNPNLFSSETGEPDRLEIAPLSDPVGPTGTDPDLEALILTREVEKGGYMINQVRGDKGLKHL